MEKMQFVVEIDPKAIHVIDGVRCVEIDNLLGSGAMPEKKTHTVAKKKKKYNRAPVSSYKSWSREAKEKLLTTVQSMQNNGSSIDWADISKQFGRSSNACKQMYTKLSAGIK